MNKKIMMLSDASNAHTRKWVKETKLKGYDVIVVSLNPGEIEDTKVYHFDEENLLKRNLFSKLSYLKHVKKIKYIIELEKPDIIHAHFASSYGFLAYLTGEPYFLNVWGRDVYDFPTKNPVNRLVIKIVLKNAQQIYSTSNVMKEVTKKYTKKSITVTPFGVDIDVFKPENRINSKTIDFTIGYIKLIEKKYGIVDLIYAFEKLVQNYPNINFKLKIVGRGSETKNMKELVHFLGLVDLVEFIPYVNGEKKIVEIYNTFDIAVFPSVEDSESFGVSAVESMACGVATVVSDVSGFKEITNNGEFALMFKRSDRAELYDKLEILLLNENLRKKLGNDARKNVLERYNVRDNFEPVFTDYENYMSDCHNSKKVKK